MQSNPLNIEISKTYSASTILQKVLKSDLDIRFGHILVEYETEKRHKYFVDTDFIKRLKTTPIKVYTIMTLPNCQNFAYRLLEFDDIKEILEKIDENNNICCVIDENDLTKAGYKSKSIKKAITLINRVLKANKMTFRASSHPEGIKIKYSKRKEKMIEEELK